MSVPQKIEAASQLVVKTAAESLSAVYAGGCIQTLKDANVSLIPRRHTGVVTAETDSVN